MDKYNILSAVMGLVVADALGVPVEFKSRESIKTNPVTGMRSYGTHSQPAGTWSDDSSMALATLEWYIDECLDDSEYEKLMQKFCRWNDFAEYTATGVRFDIGIATSSALYNYGKGIKPRLCGGAGERDNGNGSLMRILPASLMEYDRCKGGAEEYILRIFDISSLTHAHIRSKLGCLIYSYILIHLLNSNGQNKSDIIVDAIKHVRQDLEKNSIIISDDEMQVYNRIWNTEGLFNLDENEIRSSGYVVHTLEAAIWCFVNTNNYKDCVLKAVNLGDDTDTVGAVTGGLAGLYYGYADIPLEWLDVIAKKEWIVSIIDRLSLS